MWFCTNIFFIWKLSEIMVVGHTNWNINQVTRSISTVNVAVQEVANYCLWLCRNVCLIKKKNRLYLSSSNLYAKIRKFDKSEKYSILPYGLKLSYVLNGWSLRRKKIQGKGNPYLHLQFKWYPFHTFTSDHY